MKCCINGENIIRLLCLTVKLLKFEIQKCGQILCAHKPYFLMPGHNYYFRNSLNSMNTWLQKSLKIDSGVMESS